MGKHTNLVLTEESCRIWKKISALVGTLLFACILLCSTVWAEAASDQNLASHRQKAANTGSICGVLFLGYVYGGEGDNLADDSAYLEYVLDLSGCTEKFTFLEDISTDRIVEVDGGKEVYCIYPCDENASVTVYEYIMNEANDYIGETGDVLYHSENGEPIILRCNVSEIVSNCQITITDSQGETLEWQPFISLYNGTIGEPWYPPFIYDATYEAVEDYGQDRFPEDGDSYGSPLNLDGTRYIMQVTKCEEWVSLREFPDVNSERLLKIPLGAYVYDCQWYSDEFVYGQYNGQYGYVLSEYLTLIDAVPDYHGYFNYTPLPYDTITKDGTEVINYSLKGYTILASRLYDIGEVMRVGCYVNGTEPIWGYVTSVDQVTEASATEAFLAGTSEDPGVVIYNSIKGLYLIDLETGEVQWNVTREELELSGSLCYAVDENGTMYLAGYYGIDILAVDMDGNILWRNNAEYDDIYWPYQISVLGDEIVVDYGSGTEDGHFVVAYDRDGNHRWLDIL